MPNMTIKPKFDLAAHLAQAPSAKEVQNAERLRKQHSDIINRYKQPAQLTLKKPEQGL